MWSLCHMTCSEYNPFDSGSGAKFRLINYKLYRNKVQKVKHLTIDIDVRIIECSTKMTSCQTLMIQDYGFEVLLWLK